MGGAEPALDLNGTPATSVEGSAGDHRISIRMLKSYKNFDPMREYGIALTYNQEDAFGVSLGDWVTVKDKVTGKTFEARSYDSAGTKESKGRQNTHFEVSPALADALGLVFRDSKGKIKDWVKDSEKMKGRFFATRSAKNN
jgi:hypothetical protein